MKTFDTLINTVETLLGPKGCPWDQQQTFKSLQPYVLEEAHEVIEAVDADDDFHITEELGDLLYTVLFYAKLGEKMNRFTLEEIIKKITEKMVRRHPHVFGDVKADTPEEVMKNWDTIKAQEKGKNDKSLSTRIPPTLPALARAQKIVQQLLRKDPNQFLAPIPEEPQGEEEIGVKLFQLVAQAEREGIDAESALRKLSARFIP